MLCFFKSRMESSANDKSSNVCLLEAGIILLLQKFQKREKFSHPFSHRSITSSSSSSSSSPSTSSSSSSSSVASHSASHIAFPGSSLADSSLQADADKAAFTVSASEKPLLDMEDVRVWLRKSGDVCGNIARFGLPETSWKNKAPWHDPPPDFLAKGLEWPRQSFESEEHKREYYRKAREARPFLFGAPPTWTFMLANVGFLAFLICKPFGK